MSIFQHRPTTNELDTCALGVSTAPYLHLVGPTVGARNWQRTAVTFLSRAVPSARNIHVGNGRWDTIEPISRMLPTQNERRAWDKHHLLHALAAGGTGLRSVVAFYLPAKDPNVAVQPLPGETYALETLADFAETTGAQHFNRRDINVVIGMDHAYSDRSGIFVEIARTAADCNLPIHQGVADTMRTAARLLLPPMPISQ